MFWITVKTPTSVYASVHTKLFTSMTSAVSFARARNCALETFPSFPYVGFDGPGLNASNAHTPTKHAQ